MVCLRRYCYWKGEFHTTVNAREFTEKKMIYNYSFVRALSWNILAGKLNIR